MQDLSERSIGRGNGVHRAAERVRLRHAAVHARKRTDAHLLHDGRLEFRPRWHLHDRRLHRLRMQSMDRILVGIDHRTARVCGDWGSDRNIRPAPYPSQWPHRRTAFYIRLVLYHRARCTDDLGHATRAVPRSGRSRLPAVQLVRNEFPGLPRVYVAGRWRHAGVYMAPADAYADWSHHSGRVNASEHGFLPRP